MFLALLKFFHHHPYAINFLENATDVYEECHVTPVSPSVTGWTAHDRVFVMNMNKYYLYTCVNERKEPNALSIFQEISSKRFLATILMLCDAFAAIQPLNL